MKKLYSFAEFKDVYLKALDALFDNHLQDDDLNYVIALREQYSNYYTRLRAELEGTENEIY